MRSESFTPCAVAFKSLMPWMMYSLRFTGTKVFTCEKLQVGCQTVNCMNVQSYDYEPGFAPEGKMVLQTNFSQTEEDYEYWKTLYCDKAAHEEKKQELTREAVARLEAECHALSGRFMCWTYGLQ